MRNIHIPVLITAILISACGQTKVITDVPDNPRAKATQELVEQYIHAITEYDPTPLETILSDDFVYSDYGRFVRTDTKGNLIYFLEEAMSLRDFKAEIKTYTITSDGRFAVLQYSYSEERASTGEWATALYYDVLEIRDGKIVAESLYYNDENYH